MVKFLVAAAGLLIAMAPQVASAQSSASAITRAEIREVAEDGTYNGVAYVRVSGRVFGQVDPREAVVGLAGLPKNAAGAYEYSSGFELIVPAAGEVVNQVVYIDAENRGRAVSQSTLGGFLQRHGASYARVQWQTEIADSVPETAQGVGLAIMRDFARWLGGETPQTAVSGDFTPVAYPRMILGGISQSAWFVNTFVAEGFNEDPVTKRGVFDAAIAVDGLGHWLAINNLAAEHGITEQFPYLADDGAPLSRRQLLKRNRSDPLFVDVANYTDFYRLRAGITSSGATTRNYRRYDLPSAHVSALGASSGRCNEGVQVEQSPVSYRPYMRALVLGMMRQIGVDAARGAKPLPRSRPFRLARQTPPASPHFNPLPGVRTPVPALDTNQNPVGGVRMPAVEHPLGRLVPPALAPAVTSSISQTCGNYGGFEPFGKAALDQVYGRKEAWLAFYNDDLEALIDQGFLLAEDRPQMLREAGELYDRWP
jgi:hypothetical protein